MKNLRVINVLSPDVYEDCHIKGSINVPYDSLADYAKDVPKDTELVVYCASYRCPMSKRAWHLLKDQGFTNIKAYEGGAAEWYSLGHPTEGPAEKSYLKEKYDQTFDNGDMEIITAEQLREKLSF